MQAVTLASTRNMPREVWLALRKQGIGGSDAAAIMSANPYRSPLAVYYDKLGIADEKETTEAMRQGTDLEGYVADRFTEETGLSVRRANRIFRHPLHPWMLANIDRCIVGISAGLECKTTSVHNKSDFEQGVVPETYLWQCVHYMAVTGLDAWYLAVLVLNKAFHVYKIDRNEALISALIEREKAFWNDHVLAKVPPLPSGSEEEDALIRKSHASSEASEDISDLTDIQSVLDFLPALERDAKDAQQRYKAARQRVALALGNCVYGVANGWFVSNKPQTRTDVEDSRLRKDHPDIYAQYTKKTIYPVLRIKKEK